MSDATLVAVGYVLALTLYAVVVFVMIFLSVV